MFSCLPELGCNAMLTGEQSRHCS